MEQMSKQLPFENLEEMTGDPGKPVAGVENCWKGVGGRGQGVSGGGKERVVLISAALL